MTNVPDHHSCRLHQNSNNFEGFGSTPGLLEQELNSVIRNSHQRSRIFNRTSSTKKFNHCGSFVALRAQTNNRNFEARKILYVWVANCFVIQNLCQLSSIQRCLVQIQITSMGMLQTIFRHQRRSPNSKCN